MVAQTLQISFTPGIGACSALGNDEPSNRVQSRLYILERNISESEHGLRVRSEMQGTSGSGRRPSDGGRLVNIHIRMLTNLQYPAHSTNAPEFLPQLTIPQLLLVVFLLLGPECNPR